MPELTTPLAALPESSAQRHVQLRDTLQRLPDYGAVPATLKTALVLDAIAANGCLCEPHGTTRELLELLQLIGSADLAAGRIYEGHVNALLLIARYASSEQKQGWFADAAAGHWFGVWNTDGRVPVTREIIGETFVLQGEKGFCSGARRVTRGLITATLSPTTREMIIVPMEQLHADAIDDSSWRPLGMESSESLTVDFSNLVLPSAAKFGTEFDYVREPMFTAGSIRFVAVQLGGVIALTNALYTDLQKRNKTADIFNQLRCGEVALEVESGRLWLAAAANLQDRFISEDIAAQSELLHYVRMARAAIERLALRVLTLVDRSVGAHGLREPLPFAQLHRDLVMYLRQPAPDNVLVAIGQHELTRRHERF